MKKIFQYIAMAVALVAMASCSQEEMFEPDAPKVVKGMEFVVSDFPAYDDPQTRTIGTPEDGKTEWEEGDEILMIFDSPKYGVQSATLRYTESQWMLPEGVTFKYLEGETPEISAVYSPISEVSGGMFVTADQFGTTEYLWGRCNLSADGRSINISFGGRTYSRLRIAAEADKELRVNVTGFTPAGPEGATAPESYTLTTDDKGNAFLYGLFAEGATLKVKNDSQTTSRTFGKATEHGKSYALDVTTKLAFSVASDRQVLFSQGNLQYHPKNDKWRFATKQTESIGADNANISSTYDGWIDLFGWSASTANAKFGVSTSVFVSDYTGDFVDWGKNQIGDYAPDTWRTLSDDEWEYLISKRKKASSLQGVAQVDGVNGLILLPDNWSSPSGVTFKSGYHSEYTAEAFAQYQSFTAAQWAKLETNGAIFLPTTGYRDGSMVSNTASIGFYWSSEGYSSNAGYKFAFYSHIALVSNSYRYLGFSVRLVKDL